MVHIWDADRRWHQLRTNEVGNFWTQGLLTPPYRVAIEIDGEWTWKPGELHVPSCNTCHEAGSGVGLVTPWPD